MSGLESFDFNKLWELPPTQLAGFPTYAGEGQGTNNASLPNSSAGNSTSTNAFSSNATTTTQQQQQPSHASQWAQLDATTQAWLAAQQINNNASSVGLPASTASAQAQALAAMVGQGVQQPYMGSGGGGGGAGAGGGSLPMPSLSLSGLNPAGHQAALQALLSGAAAGGGKLSDPALAAAFAAAGGAQPTKATDQATLAATATRPLANTAGQDSQSSRSPAPGSISLPAPTASASQPANNAQQPQRQHLPSPFANISADTYANLIQQANSTLYGSQSQSQQQQQQQQGPANANNQQLLPASSSAAVAATAAKYLPILLDLRGASMSLPSYGTGANNGGAAPAASPALPQYAFTAEDVARHQQQQQQQHNLYATVQSQQHAPQVNGSEQQRASSHGRAGSAGQGGGSSDGGMNPSEGANAASAAPGASSSATAAGAFAFAQAPAVSGSNEGNIAVTDAIPKVEPNTAGPTAASSSAADTKTKVEGYSPDDPYIPALGRGARRSSGTGRPRVSYKEHLDTSSGDSDNSADSDFADEDDVGAGSSSKSRRTSSGGGGGRGRGRPRKSSNAGALGFAAPKPAVANGMTLTGLPPPFIPGSHAAGGVLLEGGEHEPMYDPALLGEGSTSNGAETSGGNKSSSKNRKRSSPGSTPGAIDPATGFPRRTTEIPAVEDDPTIRPYGCNWCFTERREIERFARRQRRAMGLMDPNGKGRAMDQLPSLTGPPGVGLDALPMFSGAGLAGGIVGAPQNGTGEPDQDDYDSEEERQLSAAAIDPNLPPIQWRTVKELREHMSKEHKDRPLKVKKDDKEDGGMGYLGDLGGLPNLNGGSGEGDISAPGAGAGSAPEDRILSPADMPFRCALVPCDKTFKSLAGLRFHFQNASTNGHFVVQVDLDPETGEERATKKFKVDAKPSGRELKCPIPRCPKRFKQAAGLAYHLSHTPNHPVTEAMLEGFEPTLLSKTKWWFNKQGLTLAQE